MAPPVLNAITNYYVPYYYAYYQNQIIPNYSLRRHLLEAAQLLEYLHIVLPQPLSLGLI